MARQKTVARPETRRKSPANSRDPGDRQRRILQAAIRFYSHHGVAETRFSRIAELAGVPRPLVNYYYPTPEALQAAIVGFVLERLKEAALSGIQAKWKSPTAALVGYAESFFNWAEKNRDLVSIWIYFYHLASYNSQFESLNDAIRATGRERIESLLYRGIEAGEFTVPKGFTVSGLALVIQGLLTGNVILVFSESQLKPARVARQTSDAILALVGGRRR